MLQGKPEHCLARGSGLPLAAMSKLHLTVEVSAHSGAQVLKAPVGPPRQHDATVRVCMEKGAEHEPWQFGIMAQTLQDC